MRWFNYITRLAISIYIINCYYFNHRELGKSARSAEEQCEHVRLKRRIGNVWKKVRKHRSDQRSGKTLFGFGQSGFGHQYVQKL